MLIKLGKYTLSKSCEGERQKEVWTKPNEKQHQTNNCRFSMHVGALKANETHNIAARAKPAANRNSPLLIDWAVSQNSRLERSKMNKQRRTTPPC